MKINLIAALQTKDRGIGLGDNLLFEIKEDMQNFVKKTKGATVIMGRKTWDTLRKKPLPNRANIVVTRNSELSFPEGVIITGSLEEAFSKAAEIGKEIFVIGGGEIYKAAMDKAAELHLTLIDGNKPADVFFPPYDAFTKVVSKEDHVDEATGLPYSFLVLER